MANKTSNVNTLQLDGYTMTPDSTEVTVLLRDPDGYILLASDADVPSGEAGYAVGCIFIDTDATGASNIYLVNEGSTSSCSFVTGTAATSFNALTDTNLNPATATAGTVPCVVGGVLTAKAGLVFGTTTPTAGNVFVANGTTWGTSTPDSAGLVAKSGNQTGIAGNKTWTGDHTFSGSVTYSGTLSVAGLALTDSSTVSSTKYIYFGDTDSYVYSPSAGELTIKAKTTAAGTLTLDGYDMSIGASGVGGITIGQTTGAGALVLNFGTSGLTVAGAVSSVITIGKTDQTGDILLGQSTGANEVKIATGNGNKTLTMVTGTGTNTVNLCTGTGTDTVSIASGAGAKVVTLGSTTGASSLTLAAGTGNISMAGVAATTITIGKSDQTGKISIGDSTGALTIDVGVGGTAVKTVNIANEATQAHVINIGGAASLPMISGATVTIAAGTLLDINAEVDISADVVVDGDIDLTDGYVRASRFMEEKYFFYDDFAETPAALASTVYSKCHWAGAGTNGTQTITAANNGVIVLSTTATGSSTSTLTYNGATTTDNDKHPYFEAHVSLDNITNTKMNVGLYADANDYIMFEFDTADDANKIYLVTKNNGGAEDAQETGVNLTAGGTFIFAIDIDDDDTYEVSINGVDVCETPSGSIRNVSFKPYFYVDNKAAAEEKKLSVDYCKFWQDRA